MTLDIEPYELVVVLGSQIVKKNNIYTLPEDTALRAMAAGIAWKMGIARKFIISGGYNVGVRYSETEILLKPDFSFEALAKARKEKSEAQVIRDFMRDNFGVPEELMLLEELSATTEENAIFVSVLLRRTTFQEIARIGILTRLYHMPKALQLFDKAFKQFNLKVKVEPLIAEDIVRVLGEEWVDKVSEFYSIPRGGKQWPVEKIRELLSQRKSLRELIDINII